MTDGMSRPVRLIGGLCDGQIKNVDPDQVEHIARERVRYTRREVRMPAGIITYFAIDKMSDFEALQHVLGP